MLNFSQFKAALTDMSYDNRYSVETAYRKASVDGTLEGTALQRKFLNEYNKLEQSPFKPIEKKGARNHVIMTGITFTHHGVTDEIDFSKEEFKAYKKAFDYAFTQMTLWPRIHQGYRDELEVTFGRGSEMIIRKSKLPKYSSDPLSTKSLDLTIAEAASIKHSSTLRVTVETEKTLLIKHDSKTNNYIIYASDAHPNESKEEQWASAREIFRTDGVNAPLGVEIDSIKYKKPYRYRHVKNHIAELNFGRNGLEITRESDMKDEPASKKEIIKEPNTESRYQPDNANMGKDMKRNTTKDKTFALLTEYGKSAKTKIQGDAILRKAGYKPGAYHSEIMDCLSSMRDNVRYTSHDKIMAMCKNNQICAFDPASAEELLNKFMRGQKKRINYYPVSDRTDGKKNKNPLALAAVDPNTWELKGLLRMDDPEAQPIFEEMAQFMSHKLGFDYAIKIPKPDPGNRYIPDSQKPDFMRKGYQQDRESQSGPSY